MSTHESAMMGRGYYNAHSQEQDNANAIALPMLEQAAAAATLPAPGEPAVVADYGASQGHNSLAPMRTVIATLRRRLAPDAAISIVHTDLPSNDFSALFTLLAESPDSYLRGAAEVYPSAIGRSFYQPLFASGQVALGYSAIAVHWLSAAPCPIPNHIWPPRAEDAVRAAFAARARTDWDTFLACRARELRPGGRLVVVGSLADSAGRSGAEGLLDLANDVLQELVAAGTLAAATYQQMVLPMYYRTLEEYTAPFSMHPASDGTSLQLIASEPVALADVFWARYQEAGDRQAYAAAYTGFLRAFTEPTLFGANVPAVPPQSSKRLADEFYRRVQERIMADPARVRCAWQIVLLHLAKAP
ncbi:MAG TPA: SAM-dependent methyltransferase [Chloroflexota bacterium]|nr:SAM-dependent methyltransferase [Chloroflexota bacterium]